MFDIGVKVKKLFSDEEDKKTMSAEIIKRDGKTFYLLDEETFCTLLALSKAEVMEGDEL